MKRPLTTKLRRLTDLGDAENLDAYLRLALEEDAAFDDATTQATIPADAKARANMLAKSSGVFCGGTIVRRVFGLLDPALKVRLLKKEGAEIVRGDIVATVAGSARSILSAERVALNFVQRLSGIATLTRAYVEAAGGAKIAILDTRKTTPLWRALERSAVRAGGGKNHRFALNDMLMIKDNHADMSGGTGAAARLARARRPDLPMAVEARTLEEALEAVEAGADVVMLDNMSHLQMRRAVKAIGGRALTEATGGMQPRDVRRLARIGIDRISVGALTHSAASLDISLDIDTAGRRAPKRK